MTVASARRPHGLTAGDVTRLGSDSDRRAPQRWVFTATWFVVVTLLTGCAPAGTPQLEPSISDIPRISSPDQVEFPINSYLPSDEQNVAMMLEGLHLVNECRAAEGDTGTSQIVLTRQGVDPSAATQPGASVADLTRYVAAWRRDAVTFSGMWQFFDPDNAADYGYQRPPNELPNLMLTGSGSAVMACMDRVRSISPGGQVVGPFMVGDLPDGGSQWQANDSRYVAVEKQWADCMAAAGFDYATPKDAIGQNYQASTATDKARATAVAVADVQCKIQTNLVGVAVAVQSAYDQIYIDSHRDQLAALQTQIADYIAGGVTVPASAPPTTVSTAPSLPAGSVHS